MAKTTSNKKIHLIAVDMGYGHLRAAYPLARLANQGKIINANSYAGIPSSDRKIWLESRKTYEFFSRFKNFPMVGGIAWDIFDKLQEIKPFYPKRDESAPTLQVRATYALSKRKKWGTHVIATLGKKPRLRQGSGGQALPIVSTFFIPAFLAEIWQYPGDIYCVATDTDVSRAWAPLCPRQSRIKYFAPTERVKERLICYGVKEENIFLTGFPLPDELIGGAKNKKIKKNLGARLFNLDPKKIYANQFRETIAHHLGANNFPRKKHHPLTLMFAVGGAGAQRELGIEIVKGLQTKIRKNKIRIILVAGIHNRVNRYFRKEIAKLGLSAFLKRNIGIIVNPNKTEYFKKFNRALATTDILWTKPSELSFYASLGLPIVMSEPIGSQEKFNRRWIASIGAGIDQENPAFAGEWLFDWLNSGWFAEAAMNGFLNYSTDGVENIKKIIN
ncbi:MAG: hypothetical protein V1928_05005 [Parcubacteria group bacterium]